MTHEQRTAQFVERLREIAKIIPHDELAKALKMNRPTMENWLYRDKPNRFAVKALKPLVDRKWRAHCAKEVNGRN